MNKSLDLMIYRSKIGLSKLLLLIPGFAGKRKKVVFRRTEERKIENKILSKTAFFTEYPSKGIPWMVNKCCLISEELKFIYCRIPKAANSTIIATLYNAQYHKSSFSRDEMNNIKMYSYTKPGELSKRHIQLNASQYFSFTITRNPYTRIISAYRDKIKDSSSRIHHRYEALEFLKKGENEIISLEEFLDFLEFGNGLKANYHWARQVDILAIPISKLSFIGKVETINKDLKLITQKIFGETKDIIHWAPHSTTKKKKNTFNNELEVTHKQRERIVKLYQEDFSRFGYNPDNILN